MANVQVSNMINFNASTTKQLAMGSNLTAGNALIVIVSYFNPAVRTVTLSDTRGHTYTQISSGSFPYYDGVLDVGLVAFYVDNITAGANTITATFSASSEFGGGIVAFEESELGDFIGGIVAQQNAPGTGANALSSGNVNVTTQPAIAYALSFNNTTTSAPNAGTGFTDLGTVWVDGSPYGRVERIRRTATGNAASTFTAVNGASAYYTLQVVFTEAGSSVVDTPITVDPAGAIASEPSVVGLISNEAFTLPVSRATGTFEGQALPFELMQPGTAGDSVGQGADVSLLFVNLVEIDVDSASLTFEGQTVTLLHANNYVLVVDTSHATANGSDVSMILPISVVSTAVGARDIRRIVMGSHFSRG